jgi:hypothetical protein
MVWYHSLQRPSLRYLSFSAVLVLFSVLSGEKPPENGITCRFNSQKLELPSRMQRERQPYRRNLGLTNAQLDTLSNWYSPARHYVEIIRQDDPLQPRFGIALGFEFDGANAGYPYMPAFAKLQLKDFHWGGVEFSLRDSFNFTGVSNAVSDDIAVWVDGFENDTIFGRFSGLLLSGAGAMAPVDSGYFRAFVYTVE